MLGLSCCATRLIEVWKRQFNAQMLQLAGVPVWLRTVFLVGLRMAADSAYPTSTDNAETRIISASPIMLIC